MEESNECQQQDDAEFYDEMLKLGRERTPPAELIAFMLGAHLAKDYLKDRDEKQR